MKFYNFFIIFYYCNYITLNTFSFFKSIYLNNNFFNFFNFKNNKKNYIYYYIMFKKQNSLIKKKFNYLHNLHPIFYKKVGKKKIVNNRLNSLNNITLIKDFSNLKFFLKKQNKSSFINTLNGKKKIRKFNLLNRKLYKFLNFNLLKTSIKVTKSINFFSRFKNYNRLLKLEFSLFNIILNSKFIKSYNDLNTLFKLNTIYINRIQINNPFYLLKVKDIIEFQLSNKFYNYIFYFKSVFSKHLLKIRNKLWFKLKLLNRNKLDFNKNSLINNVFKNNLIFKLNIPNYIEVDYFTLSIILIYKNFNLKQLNLNIKKILIIYLFRLYNWK